MHDRQEPQNVEPIPASAARDRTADAEAVDTRRRGDWQGYDPTLLKALFED
jgi:hypothetical protein